MCYSLEDEYRHSAWRINSGMFRKLSTLSIAVQSTALSKLSLLNRLLSSTQEAFLNGSGQVVSDDFQCGP